MKYWKFVIKCAWRGLASYKKMMLLIICVLSVLLSMAMAVFSCELTELGVLQQTDADQRTYKIYMHDWELPTMPELNTLLFGQIYPKVEKLMQPLEVESYILKESDEDADVLTGSAQPYELVKTAFQGVAVFPENQELYHVQEEPLLSGRWFTAEELQDGANVVIVSDYWLRTNGYDADASTVEIATFEYRVIGVTSYQSDSLYPQNYIPYTAAQSATDLAGFVPKYRIEVMFTQKLTARELQSIQSLFSFDNMSSFATVSNADFTEQENQGAIYATLAVIAVLFVLCCVNVLGIFRFILGKSIYDILVYKVCGGKNRDCKRILYMMVLILSFIAILIGNVLFMGISGVLCLPLPAKYRLYIGVLYVTILLCSVNMVIRRFARLMPLEDQIWYLYGA